MAWLARPTSRVRGGSALGGSLPGVARVQGVPGNATPSASHKYLIETNPALTELKQFLTRTTCSAAWA